MRKSLPLLLLVSMTGLARADRLIDIPTAGKIPFGTYRVEFADQTWTGGTQLGYLDVGVGTAFEASLRTQRIDSGPTVPAFDFSYNYISPIPDLTPGLAAGIQDIANRTRDGRRAYVCTTFRQTAQSLNGEVTTDLTMGLYFQKGVEGFVGASIPFSKQVRLLAEANFDRLSVGVEVRPINSVALRLLQRGPSTLADLSLIGHF